MIQAIFRSNFTLFGVPMVVNLFGESMGSVPSLLISVVIPIYNVLAVIVLEVFRGGEIHPKKIIINILKNPFLDAAILGVLFMVTGWKLPTFGETVVAGASAASSVENFIYIAMNSIHHATISFTSQNYGAGNYQRIRRVFFIAEGCVIVVGLLMGGLILYFATTILKLYTTSAFVMTHALVRMRILCATYFLCGMMDVAVGALRGVGQSVMPMLVSLVGVCGLRLLWVATVFQIPRFRTINTIYTAYPLSWAITTLVHFICLYCVMNQVKKHLTT